ncbi:MAG: ABC transporter permease [Bacteroidota bacterium]
MWFKKSNSKKYSTSLSEIAWKRLKKNKLAMLGLIFIIIAVFVAVSGALIRPDSTPLANEMILQLATKPPGFKVKMLQIKKNSPKEDVSFWDMLFFGGKENDYRSIPISSYMFDKDDIVVREYTEGDASIGEETRYNIADVVYPLSVSNSPELDGKGNLIFVTVENKREVKSIAEIQQLIIAKNIVDKKFYLGTDRFGRDMLSRLMSGTLVSLAVGFISVFISIIIGILFGALAGYFRGWVDDIIILFINVVWSIPTLLLVIAITLVLGKGFWQIFVAVGLTMWVEVARVVRGQFISLREKEFVEAGKALGFKNFRIIFKHVLPNVMGPVIVISASDFANAILMEAGLSFLGIGAQPPMSSWGSMIKDHYGYFITDNAAFLAILPGLAIMLMVLAFTLLGNGLRDALDAKALK